MQLLHCIYIYFNSFDIVTLVIAYDMYMPVKDLLYYIAFQLLIYTDI